MGVVRVNSLDSLLKGALHAASVFEWERQAEDIIDAASADDSDVGGHQCVRNMLAGMMEDDIPLLLAVGRASHSTVVKQYETVYQRFYAGSVLLISDQYDNVVALAVPMGEPVFVPEGEQGFLPRALKEAEHSHSALEMWVKVVCVAPFPELSYQYWWRRSSRYPELFNWKLDAANDPDGLNLVQGTSAITYLPRAVSSTGPRLTGLHWTALDWTASG